MEMPKVAWKEGKYLWSQWFYVERDYSQTVITAAMALNPAIIVVAQKGEVKVSRCETVSRAAAASAAVKMLGRPPTDDEIEARAWPVECVLHLTPPLP
jgi:hypothetical protein